jgi:hypothetical protein
VLPRRISGVREQEDLAGCWKFGLPRRVAEVVRHAAGVGDGGGWGGASMDGEQGRWATHGVDGGGQGGAARPVELRV